MPVRGVMQTVYDNYFNENLKVRFIKLLPPTDAQEECFKMSVKIYIKHAPT